MSHLRKQLSPAQRAILEDATLSSQAQALYFVLWTRCTKTIEMIEAREEMSVIEQAEGLLREIPVLMERIYRGEHPEVFEARKQLS